MGSLLCLNTTRNSRGSEIINHFRLVRARCGPVLPGAVNSHTAGPHRARIWPEMTDYFASTTVTTYE